MCLKLDDDMIACIADKTEEFLLLVLSNSEAICDKNRRKTVSAEDIKQVVREGNLPFYSVLQRR